MLLFAANQYATLLCLAALVITVCFLLMRSQKSLSQSGRTTSVRFPPPDPEGEKPGHRTAAPTDMLRWEVAMHETARELSAQLDSKLGTLQQLIHEADRAAARLEAALGAAGDRPPSDAAADAATQRFSASESRPVSQAEALRSASSERAQPDARSQPPARSAGDQRYQEIYTLADYGYPAAEIAQRLGSPVGEIELILSLRDKR